jgi:hypothetical protein
LFCAAGASDATTLQARNGGGAPAAKLSARHIAARDKTAPLYICRVVLLLLRHGRGAAGNGPRATINYQRRTTSDVAGNGLDMGTTTKYL